MGESQRIIVGDWTVTPSRNLLEREGESLKINPLTMEVLVYLAHHTGEVVSTDELISFVWQGRAVGDGTVYQNITQLRHALGDSAEEGRFIETIPKRGYRLVATVSPLDSASNEGAHLTHARHRLKWKTGFAGAGTLVVALALIVYYGADEEYLAVLPNSLAVLPFENLSPNPDDAYFAAGMHEEILSQLAKLSGLNVIARTSVAQYAISDKPISQIAEELNVEAVMEGSVRYADDRIIVTAQLIDPETDAHLWSDSYNRDFADVFAIQADIATNITSALEAEFSLSEQASIEKMPTQSPAAYAVYLKALSARGTGGESFRALLNQAIALDPDFALAYVERADGNLGRLVGLATNTATDEALEVEGSIYEDAQRALAIDPTLALAHAALAAVHQANWRGTEAEQAFQHALTLSPKDVHVLVEYGRFKRARGEHEEAVRLMRRAIELDPNNLFPRGELAITYRYAAKWDAAAAAFQEVLNRDPASLGSLSWNVHLGYVEASRGNAAEAVTRLQLAERLGAPPVYRLAQMALAYSLAGSPDDAMRLFADFEEQATQGRIGDGWWAYALTAVDDYEQALQRIESAVIKGLPIDHTPLYALAGNSWGDPELEKPEFRALLDTLWIDE